MCGRFQLNDSALETVDKIARIPRTVQLELNLGTRFPSQPALVLMERSHELYGALMDFGFYTSNLKKRIINARAETAAEKSMFSNAIAHRRCVVPCSVFYEWDAQKQMISFFKENHETMYLGAIYIENQFIILTTEANASIRPYHSRMPLVLDLEQAREWVLNSSASNALLHMHPESLSHYLPERMPRLF